MSGPPEPSSGRAVNANHFPSAENAADSPTTDTPLAIARFNATLGSAVGVSSPDGVGTGVTTGLGSVVGVGSAVWVGSVVGPTVAATSGVGAGVSTGLGAVLAVAGDAVGATSVGVGVGVAFGGCVSARAVGSETTNTLCRPALSWPTTMACPSVGDPMTDFGAASRSIRSPACSPRAAQSGWSPLGQTSSSAATL